VVGGVEALGARGWVGCVLLLFDLCLVGDYGGVGDYCGAHDEIVRM
jgi:hypothetical protein